MLSGSVIGAELQSSKVNKKRQEYPQTSKNLGRKK
jgi:hypothetical protein